MLVPEDDDLKESEEIENDDEEVIDESENEEEETGEEQSEQEEEPETPADDDEADEEESAEKKDKPGEEQKPKQDKDTQETDWKKRFKTPDAMFEEIKKLQSEKDKAVSKLKTKDKSKKVSSEQDQSDKSKLSFEEQFVVDPKSAIASVVEEIITSTVGTNMKFVSEQRINTIMDEVKKVYPDFDFDENENNEKLVKELSKLSDDFRAENPVEALTMAVKNIVGDDYTKKKITQSVEKKKKAHTEGNSLKAPAKSSSEEKEIDAIMEANQSSSLPI